jgi:hypothetical protein
MKSKGVCFVIAPIGDEGSETRHRSERVFEDVIKPAAKRCGYVPLHAMDVSEPGLITKSIIGLVVRSPLVVADLTGGNPNVFYELALRHGAGMPVILITAKNEEIPFDLKDARTVLYDIDIVSSRNQAIDQIVKQIKESEKNRNLDTPVSAAGVAPLALLVQDERVGPARDSPTMGIGSRAEERAMDTVLAELERLPNAGAIPAMTKFIEELLKSPHIHLLDSPVDDLEAACALVNSVPERGYISAASSLQHHDADESEIYRYLVNHALERNVSYCKVICFSPAILPERHEKWLQEFQDEAELIKTGRIRPDAFQLLHYPSSISVDVLISQDFSGKCLEMVAGFSGGGKHGGFRTDDQKMVNEWFGTYLEANIIVVAKRHTEAVLNGREQCSCLEFLKLLKRARRAALRPRSALARKRSQRQHGE